MKKTFILFLMLSVNAFASERFNIVSELSNISFATIKKQYVVEPVVVNNVQGKYSNGMFDLSVDFNSIDTSVTIRDSRINQIFLKTNLFPLVNIKGHFDMDSITKAITKTSIKADVSFYGNTKEFEFPVIIHKSEGLITVNSYRPIIIKGSDFNIPSKNLINLATTVGGISISDAIPLNIHLTFEVALK